MAYNTSSGSYQVTMVTTTSPSRPQNIVGSYFSYLGSYRYHNSVTIEHPLLVPLIEALNKEATTEQTLKVFYQDMEEVFRKDDSASDSLTKAYAALFRSITILNASAVFEDYRSSLKETNERGTYLGWSLQTSCGDFYANTEPGLKKMPGEHLPRYIEEHCLDTISYISYMEVVAKRKKKWDLQGVPLSYLLEIYTPNT